EVLLPLDGSRWLGGDVDDHAVDVVDLVGDAGGDLLQHVVRNAGPVGGHGILGGHWAQHEWVAVGAAVALDSDGADIGKQYDWALPDVTVEASVGQLGTRNQVCLTQDF